MIDEKKLDEIAYRFATSQTHGELLALIDGYKEGYKEGYKNAINELINSKNLKLNCIIYPKDNSYCIDLNTKESAFLVPSDPFEDFGYTPSDFGPFLLTKLPYKEEIICFGGGKKKYLFVNCLSKSTNKEYRVLYHSELRKDNSIFI